MKRFNLAVLLLCFYSFNAFAVVDKIPAGEATIQMTCEDAAAKNVQLSIQDKDAKDKFTSEDILAISSRVMECNAKAYNDNEIKNGSDNRVLASGYVSSSKGTKKVVFGLIKISKKDEGAIRQVCQGAAKAAGAIIAEPLESTVVTVAGTYNCGAYVDSLIKNDAMLFVAPTLVQGISITKDVLKAVGVPKKTIEKAERDIKNIVIASAFPGATVIKKNIGCQKLLGNRVCP